MRISILIPTLRENIEYLKMTVDSIRKYSHEPHEIIVCTNDGNPWDVGIEGVRTVHNIPQGQCGAVNLGVKNATNDFILVSDDDVVFPPNWEELTEKTKEVDFLSGNFMEGRCKGVGSCYPWTIYNAGDNPQNFNWEEWEKKSIELAEQRWENGFGFPLICKKSLWEEIGGYDESFDPWGSNCESDVEYKLMLKGIMPMRWRGVLTYHFSNISGTFTKPEALPYWERNKRLFGEKWGLIRAGIPQIWLCDFKIDGKNLRYRPSWAKILGNPNIKL